MNDLQLCRKTVHRQGLEHIADDVVLDRLFGVLKIIVAAQKGDVHRRANLTHLPRQLNAGDKGHTDIGQQQVRLQPLDQLQRVQPVAGAAHQVEAQRFPRDHRTDGLAQLVLVVGNKHRINVFICHKVPLFRFTGNCAARCTAFPPWRG